VAFWPPAPGACGSTVFGVAFSANGKLLTSGSGDGKVRLWNPATGRPVGKPLHASTQYGAPGWRSAPAASCWPAAAATSRCGSTVVHAEFSAAGRRIDAGPPRMERGVGLAYRATGRWSLATISAGDRGE
jgi:WD40 repeat protein